MKNLRWMLLLLMGGFAAGAWADSQRCFDMYPPDAYEDDERNTLVEECLALYAPEPQQPVYEETTSAEPAYYEGTVEDYVNEVPAE